MNAGCINCDKNVAAAAAKQSKNQTLGYCPHGPNGSTIT
jgi:hypothetical protein